MEETIRGVSGFAAYSLIPTPEGGVSVTVFQDKAGTDKSVERAREWIQENAPNLSLNPPGVSEGHVILKLS